MITREAETVTCGKPTEFRRQFYKFIEKMALSIGRLSYRKKREEKMMKDKITIFLVWNIFSKEKKWKKRQDDQWSGKDEEKIKR